MKRIGIDARLYFQTGVGVYLRNFLHYLQQMNNEDWEFYIYVMNFDSQKIHFSKKNFIKREVPYYWHSFSEQIGFWRTLSKDHLDLMHFTYFSYPILYKKKFISTVHDTILLQHKTGQASTKNWLTYQIKHLAARLAFHQQIVHATAIITPTASVKNEILKLYGEKYSEKIIPIHEGINYELLNDAKTIGQTTGNLHVTKPFFLYVGNFYPHKNVDRLIEAFAKIPEDVQLLLIGPADFFSETTRQLVKKLGQEKRIIFFHNAQKEDLMYCYQHALALVHPSLQEGFGLPLLEAAYFQLPIIASHIPVFRELLGFHYVAFDPYNVADIQKKLAYFLKKRPKFDYADIVRQYSFATMTEHIVQLYRKYV